MESHRLLLGVIVVGIVFGALVIGKPSITGFVPTETYSKVREALANEEKARQDLENTKRAVALNTRSAFLGVTNGVAQIKALEAALVSSQSSLDSTKLGQEVGVRTQVDVLNSTQQLISARRDHAQAIYAYAVNVLKLKAAAGTLTEDDLAYVNAWLEK